MCYLIAVPKVIITQKCYYDYCYSFINLQRFLKNTQHIKTFFSQKYRSLHFKLEYKKCIQIIMLQIKCDDYGLLLLSHFSRARLCATP